MNPTENSVAFGAPGIEPRWTSSAKEGLGTAYHTSCRVWFTLSHGIVNEIYYPTVDQPNTRDFQLLISDGETFCHEEKRDLEHQIEYADWLAAHVEEWTITTAGELVEGLRRHYIRINPTDPGTPDPHADPNISMLCIANGGGLRPAKNVVGGDFLHLVRLGIRAADDPLVRDSIAVIDHILKVELPQGPGWRRYNHDGYGQKKNGSAYDGTGVGRSWPILTGERGHYELAAGHDPKPFIAAMEKFANEGGMITEQLWDAEDLPEKGMRRGLPTGAAMPLCWSHAEYVSLVRSAHDGVSFDRVEPAYQRYVVKPVVNRHEMWSHRHSIRRVPPGQILRLIVEAEATVVWSDTAWASSNKADTTLISALGLWFADLPTENCPDGSVIEFTFFWKAGQRWEGRNYSVAVSGQVKKPPETRKSHKSNPSAKRVQRPLDGRGSDE